MKKSTKERKLANAKEYYSNNNRQNRRKGNKRNNRPDNANNNSTPDTSGNVKYMNDGSWYARDEQLLKDVARIAYNVPIGLSLRRSGRLVAPDTTSFSVPGIAMMNVVPTYGFAYSPSDPINVAFSAMFTYIRSHTSSKFDWDDNTLAINLMATDSLYYMTTWMERLYATLPLFHQSNKYLPRTLLEAQGIDYDDFLKNSAKFRAELNMRIRTINALKVPSELYIFNRHQWMFQNYYIEGESTKDQIYFYKPAAYYIHTKDSNGISMLKCHRTLAGGTGYLGRLTADDLIRKLDAMLDPIFNDQYFNLISGYIEEAYAGKVMQIPYLPDQVLLPLVFNEEVLLQFKNAKTYPVRHATSGTGYLDDTFDLTQEPASLTDPRICLKTKWSGAAFRVYRSLVSNTAVDVDATSPIEVWWNWLATANEYTKDEIITSPHANVTEMENMINTRLIPKFEVSIAAGGLPYTQLDNVWCGTEWPISVEIFTRYEDITTGVYDDFSYEYHTVMYYDSTLSNAENVVSTLLATSSVFKYFPELRVVTRNLPESADPTAVHESRIPYFEMDNYAKVTTEELRMIHRAAELSMLRVPEIASTN